MSRIFTDGVVAGRLTRCVAALLCALTLAAQLASMAHGTTVTHVTCAEHGESMEVVASADADRHAHTGACVRAIAGDSHHEHCVIASFRRERSTAAVATVRASAPILRGEASSSDRFAHAPASPIPLILLAPKSSPPV